MALGIDVIHTQRGLCSEEGIRKAFADPKNALPCQEEITPAYYVDLRYSGKQWKHWDVYVKGTFSSNSTSMGVGAELYKGWFSDRFITGLGLLYAQPDEIVGSGLRYGLRFAWCPRRARRLCGELIHTSCFRNNSLATCEETDSNRGYNYLTLRLLLGTQKETSKH